MPKPYAIINADCREILKTFPDNYFDSIVTDPPYALTNTKGGERGFMGKTWDTGEVAFNPTFWRECLRVLKPGGHMVAFGGTRTHHRIWCAIEDAGVEIRDTIMWLHGQGFPKSLNISKAIDKAAGAEREVIGEKVRCDGKPAGIIKPMNSGSYNSNSDMIGNVVLETAPATDAAKQWDGFGTALCPGFEPIVLSRKPLSEKTIIDNVLKWGTGSINIDGCRIPLKKEGEDPRLGGNGSWTTTNMAKNTYGNYEGTKISSHAEGRWPKNVLHDGSDVVLDKFANQSERAGVHASGHRKPPTSIEYTIGTSKFGMHVSPVVSRHGDSGAVARFFYCAKTSKRDRDEGLPEGQHSDHPTIKPTELMRYLCRLVTPPGGLVLDPFAGSFSTGKACMYEGFEFYGIEQDAHYCEIGKARIEYVINALNPKPKPIHVEVQHA